MSSVAVGDSAKLPVELAEGPNISRSHSPAGGSKVVPREWAYVEIREASPKQSVRAGTHGADATLGAGRGGDVAGRARAGGETNSSAATGGNGEMGIAASSTDDESVVYHDTLTPEEAQLTISRDNGEGVPDGSADRWDSGERMADGLQDSRESDERMPNRMEPGERMLDGTEDRWDDDERVPDGSEDRRDSDECTPDVLVNQPVSNDQASDGTAGPWHGGEGMQDETGDRWDSGERALDRTVNRRDSSTVEPMQGELTKTETADSTDERQSSTACTSDGGFPAGSATEHGGTDKNSSEEVTEVHHDSPGSRSPDSPSHHSPDSPSHDSPKSPLLRSPDLPSHDWPESPLPHSPKLPMPNSPPPNVPSPKPNAPSLHSSSPGSPLAHEPQTARTGITGAANEVNFITTHEISISEPERRGRGQDTGCSASGGYYCRATPSVSRTPEATACTSSMSSAWDSGAVAGRCESVHESSATWVPTSPLSSDEPRDYYITVECRSQAEEVCCREVTEKLPGGRRGWAAKREEGMGSPVEEAIYPDHSGDGAKAEEERLSVVLVPDGFEPRGDWEENLSVSGKLPSESGTSASSATLGGLNGDAWVISDTCHGEMSVSEFPLVTPPLTGGVTIEELDDDSANGFESLDKIPTDVICYDPTPGSGETFVPDRTENAHQGRNIEENGSNPMGDSTKRSTNGYVSDASSGGGVDDVDNEVRSLTAKAFRSLSCPYEPYLEKVAPDHSSPTDTNPSAIWFPYDDISLNRWPTYVDLGWHNKATVSVASHASGEGRIVKAMAEAERTFTQCSRASMSSGRVQGQDGSSEHTHVRRQVTGTVMKRSVVLRQKQEVQQQQKAPVVMVQPEFQKPQENAVKMHMAEDTTFSCSMRSDTREETCYTMQQQQLHHQHFSQSQHTWSSSNNVSEEAVAHAQDEESAPAYAGSGKPTGHAKQATSILKNVISKKMQLEQEMKMERGELRDTSMTAECVEARFTSRVTEIDAVAPALNGDDNSVPCRRQDCKGSDNSAEAIVSSVPAAHDETQAEPASHHPHRRRHLHYRTVEGNDGNSDSAKMNKVRVNENKQEHEHGYEQEKKQRNEQKIELGNELGNEHGNKIVQGYELPLCTDVQGQNQGSHGQTHSTGKSKKGASGKATVSRNIFLHSEHSAFRSWRQRRGEHKRSRQQTLSLAQVEVQDARQQTIQIDIPRRDAARGSEIPLPVEDPPKKKECYSITTPEEKMVPAVLYVRHGTSVSDVGSTAVSSGYEIRVSDDAGNCMSAVDAPAALLAELCVERDDGGGTNQAGGIEPAASQGDEQDSKTDEHQPACATFKSNNTLYIGDATKAVVMSRSPEIKINLRNTGSDAKSSPFNVAKLLVPKIAEEPTNQMVPVVDKTQVAQVRPPASFTLPAIFKIEPVEVAAPAKIEEKAKFQAPLHQVRDVRKLVKSTYPTARVEPSNAVGAGSGNAERERMSQLLPMSLQSSAARALRAIPPLIINCKSITRREGSECQDAGGNDEDSNRSSSSCGVGTAVKLAATVAVREVEGEWRRDSEPPPYRLVSGSSDTSPYCPLLRPPSGEESRPFPATMVPENDGIADQDGSQGSGSPEGAQCGPDILRTTDKPWMVAVHPMDGASIREWSEWRRPKESAQLPPQGSHVQLLIASLEEGTKEKFQSAPTAEEITAAECALKQSAGHQQPEQQGQIEPQLQPQQLPAKPQQPRESCDTTNEEASWKEHSCKDGGSPLSHDDRETLAEVPTAQFSPRPVGIHARALFMNPPSPALRVRSSWQSQKITNKVPQPFSTARTTLASAALMGLGGSSVLGAHAGGDQGQKMVIRSVRPPCAVRTEEAKAGNVAGEKSLQQQPVQVQRREKQPETPAQVAVESEYYLTLPIKLETGEAACSQQCPDKEVMTTPPKVPPKTYKDLGQVAAPAGSSSGTRLHPRHHHQQLQHRRQQQRSFLSDERSKRSSSDSGGTSTSSKNTPSPSTVFDFVKIQNPSVVQPLVCPPSPMILQTVQCPGFAGSMPAAVLVQNNSEPLREGAELPAQMSYMRLPATQAQHKMLIDPETGQCYWVETPQQPQRKRLYDPDTQQYVEVAIPPQGLGMLPGMGGGSAVYPVPPHLMLAAPQHVPYGSAFVMYPGIIPTQMAPSPGCEYSPQQMQMMHQSQQQQQHYRSQSASGVSSEPQSPLDKPLFKGTPDEASAANDRPYFLPSGMVLAQPQAVYTLPASSAGGPQGTGADAGPRRGSGVSSESPPVQGPRILAPPLFDGTTMSFVVEHR